MQTASHSASDNAPVIIAGAGPAGMCIAIDLALKNIPSILLESNPAQTPPTARTNLTNTRSMEHFRRWGMADALRKNIPLGPEISRDIRFVTRANGHVIANFPGGVEFADRAPFASEVSLWGPQGAIEKTIRQRVASLPLIDIRFEASVTGFEQSADGVSVNYTDAQGAAHQVTGQYLVGADGSRSMVRRELGIKMTGTPKLVYGFSWLVRSPELKQIMADSSGLAAMTWFINPDRSSGILAPQHSDGHFQYFAAPVSEELDGNDWPSVRAKLFADVGKEFAVEPVSGGELWIHSLAAPRYQEGRVFLVGDAAHLVSPFGGFGMNISIGDSADIAWKLAAVIQGWGGDKLLDSYCSERREIFGWIQELCEESTKHTGPAYVREGMEEDSSRGVAIREQLAQEIMAAKAREFVSIGAQLGYAYRKSPVICADGQEAAVSTFGNYVPSAAPGARAPHIWLGADSANQSLYDLFGTGFTLLKINHDDSIEAFEQAAARRNIPLKVISVNHPELAVLYENRLALIRPDQHIAWRGDTLPQDVDQLLAIVTGASA
mgnify:FL=1